MEKNRSVIIVTHSTPLLKLCDSIMVLEKGRIRAGGPTKDILPKLQ